MSAENAIRKAVSARLVAMGLEPNMADDKMDLLQSGIFDSMSFIDMLTSVEDELGVRVDLENALAKPEIFTIAGLAALFSKVNNG